MTADYTIYTAAATGIASKLTERRTRALHRATAAIYILAAVVLATHVTHSKTPRGDSQRAVG